MTPDGTTIVGAGIHDGFGTEAWIVRIPEPGVAALIAVGVAVLHRRNRLRGLTRRSISRPAAEITRGRTRRIVQTQRDSSSIWLRYVFAFLCFAATTLPCWATDSPYFLGLGDLPGGDNYSAAFGISPNGQYVVGRSASAGPGDATGYEAFIWSKATGMSGLGDLPGGGAFGIGTAVSTNGVVSGYGETDLGTEPFRWTPSTGLLSLSELSGAGPYLGNAFDISADGNTIIGGAYNLPGSSSAQAFRWSETDGFVGLGTLPGSTSSFAQTISADGSTIAGVSSGSPYWKPFYWNAVEGMVSLGSLPATYRDCRVYGISSDGRAIVGTLVRANNDFDAFVWTANDGFTLLGDLTGGIHSSTANAISADGAVIIGRASIATGTTSFIWDAMHGLRDLREVLIADCGFDLSDWSGLHAQDMTPDGQTIVGFGQHEGLGTEAWIVHIPEPLTACLLLIGTGLLRLRRHL